MTATIVRPDADQADSADAPSTTGATAREAALAVGLWAVVGAGLTFGIAATLVKASGLFSS